MTKPFIAKIPIIVLIGYRGSGKTAVSEMIARQAGFNQISTDEIIEHFVGLIGKYIAAYGWSAFRDVETDTIMRIKKEINTRSGKRRSTKSSSQQRSNRPNGYVIDCGGGIVEREENVKLLASLGTVVWLRARPDIIEYRIAGSDRPSLTPKGLTEEIEDVLMRREPLYQAAADHVIDTDTLIPRQIARRIMERMQ